MIPSYFTFYPPEKLPQRLIRNFPQLISTEAQFCADFKKVQNSCVKQKRKKIVQKNRLFRDLTKSHEAK
jgi:hypothetical protein